MKVLKNINKISPRASLIGLGLTTPIFLFAFAQYCLVVTGLGKMSTVAGLSLADPALQSGFIKMIIWTPFWTIPLVLMVRFADCVLGRFVRAKAERFVAI